MKFEIKCMKCGSKDILIIASNKYGSEVELECNKCGEEEER